MSHHHGHHGHHGGGGEEPRTVIVEEIIVVEPGSVQYSQGQDFQQQQYQQQQADADRAAGQQQADADRAAAAADRAAAAAELAAADQAAAQATQLQQQAEAKAVEVATAQHFNEGKVTVQVDIVEKIATTISEAEAKADAEKSKNALHGGIFGHFTTKTDVLISILGPRTSADMQLIKAAYRAEYNKDFTKDISDDCSGHFKDVLLQLCDNPAELDAKLVRQSIKGLLSDEELLSEVICTRTATELKAASEAYTRLFNRNMTNDIKNDTSGDLAKVYLACLADNRGSRQADVDADVAALYKGGQGRFLGTDHKVFIDVIAQSPREHVNAVYAKYAEKHGERFDKVVREQMGGHTGKALANLVTPHHVFYAEKILRSLHGTLGVHNADLIRVITTQRGRHLKHAGKYYLEVNTKTVSSSIEKALSGDYKKLVYQICQAEGV